MDGRLTMAHVRHYQAHLVGMARQRLGRDRADVLLVDASHGAETHRRTLGKALNAEIGEYMDGHQRFIMATFKGDGPLWKGGNLNLDRHIPQTVQTFMVGMRLGDVVAGTGADDHIVDQVFDRYEGTCIRIETGLVAARTIRLRLRHRLSGPFRRAMRIVIGEWLEFGDKTHHRDPTIGDLAFQATLMCVSGFGMVASVGAMGAYGPAALALALVTAVPAFGYLATGLAYGIRVDVKRWRHART